MQSPGARPFAVTNRMVLAIALPMTLAVLTTPMMGLVDMAVVGRLGDAALLAGLAAGVVVVDIAFVSFNFLRSGTTGLVAQANGRGDVVEEQAVLWRALMLALACGLVLMVLALPAGRAGTFFIDPEPQVAEALELYVAIRFLGAPLALGNFALLGSFLGRGEAVLGLAMQVVITGVNVALSILLGLHFGLGLTGVAWATVAAEAVGLVAAGVLVATRFARLPRITWSVLFDRQAVAAILSLNRDIMIRTLALMAAFTLFARQGAQLGTLTMAANAVLMNLFFVVAYFLDGLANAAEQIVGRAVGAQHAPAVRQAVRLTAIWGFAFAAVAAFAFFVAGDALVALVTTLPDVRSEAGRYLAWAAVTAISGVLAFQMDGVYIGATWSRSMRNRMLLSLGVFVVSLLLLPPFFGNHGLWAAMHIFLWTRGLSLAAGLPGEMRRTFRYS